MLQVWLFDLACDSVELRKFVMHSAQIFLIRSRGAGVDVVCKGRNTKPIVIVPGPRGP